MTNSGTAPLNIATFGLSGTNSGDFALTDNCVSPLAGPGTCTINITFTPSLLTSESATLTFTDNSGDVAGSQQTVDLTGTGIKASTITGMTSSANPSVLHQSVTFTATVTPQGSGTPTGTVTFSDGTTAICTAVAMSSGEALCTISTLALGPHSITAVYSGDTNFLGSTSPPFGQTVTLEQTTTQITAIAPNPSMVGQPVTVSYTVTVNAPGTGTIPGTEMVTVRDSTGASCTGTIAAGNCALVPTAVGADTITAAYSGDSNFSTSQSSVAASFSIVPTISLTGMTPTNPPTQLTNVGVALNTATPTSLTGTLTLSFQSSAAGTPEGYIDPGTQFAAGGTTINFTIPAGAAIATLPQSGAIQQGTTAGTIIVTLTNLIAGTATVAIPQPNPSLSVTVQPIAPVITPGSGTITGLSSTGFNVELDAYSTPRDLANATFTFQAASGAQLNGADPSPVPLSGVAPAWFSSSSGLQSGGSFHLKVPFTFSGDTSALSSVTVTLSNSVGPSSSVTVTF